jgi:hypothetical protein
MEYSVGKDECCICGEEVEEIFSLCDVCSEKVDEWEEELDQYRFKDGSVFRWNPRSESYEKVGPK